MQFTNWKSVRSFVLGLCMVTALPATADTLYLKNGTRLHGIVSQSPQGNYIFTVRGRKLIYRPSEVLRVEKNSNTGERDLEAARARAEERNKELTEATGLDAPQRTRLKQLLLEVGNSDREKSSAARREILDMHAKHDILKYLKFRLDGYSPRFVVPILEIMYDIKPIGLHDILVRHAEHIDGRVRAEAISLLARAKHEPDRPLILRGLLDHTTTVRAAASRALSTLELPQATPLLIERLGDDREVWAAARFSLAKLWEDEGDVSSLNTPQDWSEFWQNNKSSVSEPLLTLDGLAPLIEPEMEFEDE